MPHPNELKATRILVLEGWDLEIWKVHVDSLREQDKNARIMDKRRFNQIKANIKKDKRLESLPYCVLNSDRIEIVSGHHRVRAARMAGLTEIYALVDTKHLNRSEVLSKQLAHNALVGYDDKKMLKEMWEEIDDLELRLSTGIDPEDIEVDYDEETFKNESVELEFQYKQVQLLFLPTNYEDFINTLDLVEAEFIGVADVRDFERVAETIRKVSEAEEVRNVSSILLKMCEIVNDYYRAVAGDEPIQPRVKLAEKPSKKKRPAKRKPNGPKEQAVAP